MVAVPLASIKFGLDNAEKVLRAAIEKGLSTTKLKNEVNKLAVVEIENIVIKNQALFRPDIGPDGGSELVGLLGIGQGGRPSVAKYAGPNGAWRLLQPGQAAASFTSSFRRVRQGRFAILNYEINLAEFFGNFRSTYLSRKRGDADHEISWMQNLIDGIPTEQLREYPEGETDFVFVSSGENFNPLFSRTGLGHMVPAGRLKIPARQFTFSGRGRANTFGKLFADIEKRLSSNSFKGKIEKRIADSINSGG